MAECRKTLKKQDLERLEEVPTCDALIQRLNDAHDGHVDRPLLQRLRVPLESMKNFVTLVTFAIGTSVFHTALVWGVLSLVIEVDLMCTPPKSPKLLTIKQKAARTTENHFSDVVNMLTELGHDLEVLQLYEKTLKDNEKLGADLVDIFVEIITFWCQAVNFLRRNKRGECMPESCLTCF